MSTQQNKGVIVASAIHASLISPAQVAMVGKCIMGAGRY